MLELYLIVALCLGTAGDNPDCSNLIYSDAPAEFRSVEECRKAVPLWLATRLAPEDKLEMMTNYDYAIGGCVDFNTLISISPKALNRVEKPKDNL